MPDERVRKALHGSVDHVLELARHHLGMDVAFLAEFTDGKQVYRGLAGDAASFGWRLGDGPSLPNTYCRLMTAGQIDNAIPDAAAHPVLADLPVTRDSSIGSYVGVPVRLADGTLYGSLCTLSHTAQPVDGRDAKFLAMLADLVAAEVEMGRAAAQVRAGLRDIIDNERFDIALQPIVDAHTGVLVGVEALSRFPAGSGSPDVVFASAHEVGLGMELERLAAARAYQVVEFLATDEYLSINLTPEVAIELATGLRGGLRLDRLVLEITEHAAVTSYARLRDSLADVRRDGLRLAIDDAGAGYASLHHIVELQPDIIKIDRSLIDGIDSDRARRSVVKAFVTLADELGAAVVAEGVERAAELQVARDLGVTAAQGYLLARPSLDRADLRRWQSGVPLPPQTLSALEPSDRHGAAEAVGGSPAADPRNDSAQQLERGCA